MTEPANQTATIACALALIEAAQAFCRGLGSRVLGIGVAMAGIIDDCRGVLTYSPNLSWRDVPIGQQIEHAFGLPVYVENNANAAALAEHYFGSAQLAENFLFVSIGKGIGAGLFLNGRLFRGVSGLAGEIGQSHVVQGGTWLRERTGEKRWHTFCNSEALLALVQAGGHDVKTLAEIAQLAAQGDTFVLDCLHTVGELIGLGLANLVHLFDPEKILLGGEMGAVAEFLLPSIGRIVQASDLIERPEPVAIEAATFGVDAIMMGAVTLVVRAVMRSPKRPLLATNA